MEGANKLLCRLGTGEAVDIGDNLTRLIFQWLRGPQRRPCTPSEMRFLVVIPVNRAETGDQVGRRPAPIRQGKGSLPDFIKIARLFLLIAKDKPVGLKVCFQVFVRELLKLGLNFFSAPFRICWRASDVRSFSFISFSVSEFTSYCISFFLR